MRNTSWRIEKWKCEWR